MTHSLRKLITPFFSRRSLDEADIDGESSSMHDKESPSSQPARHPLDPGQKSRSIAGKPRAQGVSSLKLKQEMER